MTSKVKLKQAPEIEWHNVKTYFFDTFILSYFDMFGSLAIIMKVLLAMKIVKID